MSFTILRDLRAYLAVLKGEGELLSIDVPVDPYLEIAEIHRRVIARGGPALLFTNVKGSRFPVATNLFGTARRLELAFGGRPRNFVAELVRTVEALPPPSLANLWRRRGLLRQGLKVGT
ncbi:MAG: UbiD family decarboxylase, partial [Deltaproteobacteria bacterium]